MNSAKSPRSARALDGLWYTCSAPQTLMLLAALLAATLAVAALFPQQPAGLDSAAVERWLTTTASSYRGTGAFLRVVGAFQVLGGPWMRVLLAALAFNLALRVGAQVRAVGRLWRAGEIPAAPPHLSAQFATLPVSLPTAFAHGEGLLRAGSSRVATEHGMMRAQLYGVGRRAGALGPLLTYLGGLLMLAGLFLNSVAGWGASDIALAPATTVALPQAAGLQVTLNDTPGAQGGALASVTLARGAAGNTVVVALAQPARWGNIWLSLQATGPALAVSAAGNDKRPLLMQSLAPGGEVNQTLHVPFQQIQGEQAFAIPTRDLAFRVVSYSALPERGIERPVFLIEGYRGAEAQPAFSELVEDQATIIVDSVTLSVRRDYFVTLKVAYLPGLLPLLIGGLAMLAGAMLSAFFGPVRAWIGMVADKEAVAVAVRVAAPAESDRVTARLLQALQAGVGGTEPAHED